MYALDYPIIAKIIIFAICMVTLVHAYNEHMINEIHAYISWWLMACTNMAMHIAHAIIFSTTDALENKGLIKIF